ncbi:MAG: hypothetical protein JXK05_04050 [Campylobacterales bacterium]|nr:hypothetical protein [Campylobacterales bacterium]
MPNPTATIERYVGGGRAYFTPYENGAYGTEYEIGEIKSASISVSSETTEAFSQDTGVELMVEDAVTKVDSTVKYTTQNVNKENMATALMATLTTEMFAIGAALPDGTTATAETTIDKIVGMQKPLQRGKLRIVGEPINGSAKRPVLIVPMVSVKPTGDNAYIMKDFKTLEFEGKVLKTVDGYFTEYLMEVA